MEESLFVVTNTHWISTAGSNPKRLEQNRYPIGRSAGHLDAGCRVLVKFRDNAGKMTTDIDGQIQEHNGFYYLHSDKLSRFVRRGVYEEHIAAFFEGTPAQARCVVQPLDQAWLDLISEDDPTLRLGLYDLPPKESTAVTSRPLVTALYRILSTEDPELFAVHVSRFLDSPHILTPLFAHLLSLRSEDDLNFIIELKKIAEQLRGLLLTEHAKSVQIHTIHRSHVDLWAEMEGRLVGFLDGGVARIPGVARVEPLALRVGVFGVRPGDVTDKREKWLMRPFVLGDCVDPSHPITENTDRRRLLEAARYTFEPLVGLQFLHHEPTCRLLLMHGPLVNQFAMYDEGEPHFIPALSRSFLEKFAITEAEIRRDLVDLPDDPRNGGPFWNHFMAVYAHVMKCIDDHRVPIAGVVERATGRSVTRAVCAALLKDRVITAAYIRKLDEILDRYDISDDFLFGCILKGGEYITPVTVEKNLERRARDRWRPVIKQLPSPAATVMKTEDNAFPFRVEMNRAAAAESEVLTRLVYHTARLLPRYAFPVGLDIADKYAKVPDWIARGVSAELSAAVIRRALRTGDAHVVAQVRQLLAKSPRDFFFRPGTDI